MPGTIRKASGMLVPPERSKSCRVMTKTAAALSERLWGFLLTEVTWIPIKSSMLKSVRSSCWARTERERPAVPKRFHSHNRAQILLIGNRICLKLANIVNSCFSKVPSPLFFPSAF